MEHVTELTLRRKHCSLPTSAGVDATAWMREVDFFINEIVDPQVADPRLIREQALQVRQFIDVATAHYPMSRAFFVIDRTPFPFEHRVADALDELGWQAGLTNGEGERGLDVTATMREKLLVVRCFLSPSPVGHSAVQRAFEEICREAVDHIAIVSNADFTPRARQRAAALRVLLLHHDELTRLEERIFGTDAWRSVALRIASAVQAEQPGFSPASDGQTGKSVHAA
jgi:restriction system protein